MLSLSRKNVTRVLKCYVHITVAQINWCSFHVALATHAIDATMRRAFKSKRMCGFRERIAFFFVFEFYFNKKNVSCELRTPSWCLEICGTMP